MPPKKKRAPLPKKRGFPTTPRASPKTMKRKRAAPPGPYESRLPKRKRPDVAKRIVNNTNCDFVARKVLLKHICTSEALKLHWDDVIKEMNRACAEGWLLANYIVLWTIENTGDTALSGELPPLNQQFFRRCMAAVSDVTRPGMTFESVHAAAFKKKKPHIPLDQWVWRNFEKAVDHYLLHRGEAPTINAEYINDGWFAATATQMATNTRTSMWKNLARRLRQYVNVMYPQHCGDAYVITSCVLDEAFKRRTCKGCRKKKRKKRKLPDRCPVCESVNEIALALRDDIPRKQNKKVDWTSPEVLQLFYRFLAAVENYNETNKDKKKVRQQRTYSILPTKQGFTASYFQITSSGLKDLLKRSSSDIDLDVTVETEGGGIISLQDSLKNKNNVWSGVADAWWRKFVRVAEFEKVNHTTGTRLEFHGEIATDGVGASVILHRPKTELEGELPPRKVEDYDVIRVSIRATRTWVL